MEREEVNAFGFALRWEIAMIVIVTLLSILGKFLFFKEVQMTQPVVQQTEVIQKVYNGDKQLGSNHYFYDQYNNVIATNRNAIAAEKALAEFKAENPKPWDYGTQQTYSNLQQTASGTRAGVEAMVAEYNAKSDAWDMNIYKGSELPHKIDPNNIPASPIQ